VLRTQAVKLNRQINVYAKSHLRQTQLHWFAALVTRVGFLVSFNPIAAFKTRVSLAASSDASNPTE
jgi:hypothetical protein